MEITGHLFERLNKTWDSPETASPWPLLTLDVAELEHLAEKEQLRPAPGSPLAALLGAFLRTSAAEREQAAERLQMRGLAGAPGAEAVATNIFRRALDIVAHPAATLTVRLLSGDSSPALIPLYLADGSAAPAFTDADGLHLGAPLSQAEVVSSIQAKILDEIPPELEHPVTVSRLALRTAEILWPGTGRAATELIPHWLAFSALAQQLSEPGHVSLLLEEIVNEGMVEERDDGYRIGQRHLPWLERWLSGEGCTIDYCPLAPEVEHGEARRPYRLSFYGAPEHWVVGTPDLGGPEADLEGTGRRPPDSGLGAPWWRPGDLGTTAEACHRWSFSAPPARALGWHLGRLFGGR